MRALVLIFSVLCMFLITSPALADDPVMVPIEATVAGKYSGLLKIIPCPTDEATYGKFKDYGKYPATKWCGADAPGGFWVYAAPNWYIWESDAAQASAGGKYSELLKIIHCPKDEATYGKFKDYGSYPATKWCGDSAPAGNWVYVSPNWYIWAKKK